MSDTDDLRETHADIVLPPAPEQMLRMKLTGEIIACATCGSELTVLYREGVWPNLIHHEDGSHTLDPALPTERTCIACGKPIPEGKGCTVGHGGRLVGTGLERRTAREGAHVCDECWEPDPPAAPIEAPTGRMRLAPEHFYTAAAEAWASVQGDQIDATDDQLRAAVGAVLDLVDENPPPRVVDVDSLAIEGLTEKERQDFLAGPDVRPAVDDDVHAVALAAFKASGASRPHVVEVFVNEDDLRAAVDAVRAPLLAEIADAHRCAGADYTVRMEYFAERKQALAERDAARAEVERLTALLANPHLINLAAGGNDMSVELEDDDG